jgi:hypothetical protein
MRTPAFAAALLLLLGAPALAEPTAQVAGGRTSVELSDDFLGALTALGVEAGAIGPASLRRGWASFPIPAGALDVETARGDIFHSGGLVLRAGSTKVRLLNFVIDTTENDDVLTGLVSVNGDLLDRVVLFDLELNEAPVIWRSGLVVVRAVDVTLSAGAAAALNDVFDVTAFSAGLPIGEAVVVTKVVGGNKDRHANDDDDDENDDDDEDED